VRVGLRRRRLLGAHDDCEAAAQAGSSQQRLDRGRRAVAGDRERQLSVERGEQPLDARERLGRQRLDREQQMLAQQLVRDRQLEHAAESLGGEPDRGAGERGEAHTVERSADRARCRAVGRLPAALAVDEQPVAVEYGRHRPGAPQGPLGKRRRQL